MVTLSLPLFPIISAWAALAAGHVYVDPYPHIPGTPSGSPEAVHNAGTNTSHNANHIFNAIHNAMRQFGSSVHHNGVSLFIATIPKGTHLFHGTLNTAPVTGMEWLAFEPEHSIFFARANRSDPSPTSPVPSFSSSVFGPGLRNPTQTVLVADTPKEAEGGYLHTFRAAHDLRVLYIDGMAAAKSTKGTLDFQTYILTNIDGRVSRIRGDVIRLGKMCERAKTQWGGHIDGFIRMEAGFELILCDFDAHLELARTLHMFPFREEEEAGVVFSFYHSITSRYHGIGGNRVSVDFDNFVTAYAYEEDLFQNTTWQNLPRLNLVSNSTLDAIRGDVDRMAATPKRITPLSGKGVQWQEVTDMIVSRYAPRLAYLRSNKFTTTSSLRHEARNILAPFFDPQSSSHSQRKEQTTACARESIPETESTSSSSSSTLAERAIRSVSERICHSLFDIAKDGSETEHEDAEFATMSRHLSELISYLDWSEWKMCTGCEVDEVCSIPMWPFGWEEDWRQPSCANTAELGGRMGYWEVYDDPDVD